MQFISEKWNGHVPTVHNINHALALDIAYCRHEQQLSSKVLRSMNLSTCYQTMRVLGPQSTSKVKWNDGPVWHGVCMPFRDKGLKIFRSHIDNNSKVMEFVYDFLWAHRHRLMASHLVLNCLLLHNPSACDYLTPLVHTQKFKAII